MVIKSISVYPPICFIFNIFAFVLFLGNYIVTCFQITVVIALKIMSQLNKIHSTDTKEIFFCFIAGDSAR
jgi:hypothetical protein